LQKKKKAGAMARAGLSQSAVRLPGLPCRPAVRARQHDTAVLLAALGGLVIGHRLALAVTGRRKTTLGNALALQVSATVWARRSELLVVVIAADAVRVARDSADTNFSGGLSVTSSSVALPSSISSAEST
jgi:hypothetical protein